MPRAVELYAEAGTDSDTVRQKMDVARQPNASDNHILYSAKVPANRPASNYAARYPLQTQGIGTARSTLRIVAALIESTRAVCIRRVCARSTREEDNFTLSSKLQQGFGTRVHIGLGNERHDAVKLLDLAFRLNSPNPEGHVQRRDPNQARTSVHTELCICAQWLAKHCDLTTDSLDVLSSANQRRLDFNFSPTETFDGLGLRGS